MQVSQQAVASPFDGLTLEQIRSRTSAKWQYYPEDVLPLWVAEMDAVVAQPIVDAVMHALANGDTGYPWGSAFPEALAGFASDRWDWSFDPSKAAPMTDVMTGVLEISRLLGQNDDAIVLTPPIYPPFAKVAEVLGRPVVTAPLDSDDRIDLDNLERAFKEATGGGKHATLLLSNPHNPTGTVHSRAELTSIAQLARKHGVRVISDEIHAPLIMPTSTFTPYLSVADSGLDFSVTSASKGWNLAGFKAAIAMAGADATSELESLNHRVGTHPGHIGVIAHTAAFNDARVWLDAAIAGIDVNRRLLAELLQEYLPAARYRLPESTYLAWIDCRELGLGDDPAAVFLEQGRVALSSGKHFGAEGVGFVRLNIATTPEILDEAVRRMASTVA